MEKHSKYATNFYAALLAHSITPGMLHVFMSRYNRCHRDEAYREQQYEQLALLDAAITKIKPRCLPEHEKSGIAFLLNKLLTPKGNLRNTPHSKEFNMRTGLFLQSHRHNLEIHLVGTTWVGNGARQAHAPVFRVSTTKPLNMPGHLRSFSYAATSWQSGGHFEICDEERV